MGLHIVPICGRELWSTPLALRCWGWGLGWSWTLGWGWGWGWGWGSPLAIGRACWRRLGLQVGVVVAAVEVVLVGAVAVSRDWAAVVAPA